MIVRRLMLTAVLSLCSLAGVVLVLEPAAPAAGPPTIEATSALNVAGTSATLQAQVNPEGSETTYRFEYGTTEAYGSKTPIPDGLAGSGSAPVTLEAHPQDLVPDTVYHFRVVLESAGGTPVDGPDQMFTTQAVGVPFALPDGREWELVSPAQKNGAQVIPLSNHNVQAAEDGSGLAYYASAPFAGESSPSNVGVSEALSRRTSQGWTTQDIAVPHETVTLAGNTAPEYRLFSPDLSGAAIEPWSYSPLSPEASERTAYMRDNATGLYTPLVTAANTAPGTHFGGEEKGNPSEGIHFITATPDLSHVVLSSREFLTSERGAPGPDYYYEWVGGKLKLITAFPPNLPSDFYTNGDGEIGLRDTNVRHAISDDGARIFWSNEAGGLFMRDVPAGESVWISAPQGVSESSGGATFQYASSDGSRAFFSTANQLTTTPGGGLYVYEAETGKLTLITVPLNAGEQAGVLGLVPGASEDGSYIYVVAQGVLNASENANHEKALSGANNLYVLHGEAAQGGGMRWSASFIAALSDEDQPSWDGGYAGLFVEMSKLISQASSNGRYFAFMSDRSLTGYDNRDAVSGQPDEEVYEYDAASATLACVSCDPTGARPEGQRESSYGTKADPTSLWYGRWIAGSVPGWFEETRGYEVANYQPRYLADSGRIFFDSPAGLVPRDVNGTEDVYQYEPSGVGSCARAQGCVSLLSGGAGPGESVFQDASTSGEDVFFVTGDRLVSEDFDNGYDMYDAHVCRAQAPCFPASSALSPPCNSGDSCKAAPSPQPLLFGAPASATFSGAGNLTPGPVAVNSTRGLTSAQRSARALRACRRMHRRSRRMACERRAEQRYGKQAGRKPGVSRVRTSTSARTGR